MEKADLHCHSTCSDGKYSPKEILSLAKKANLFGLSLTDHDTLDGYTKEFFDLAKEMGLEILAGVEISSECLDHTIHILAYGNSLLQSEDFSSFLKEVQKRRKERNEEILKKLRDRGMDVSEVDFFPSRERGGKVEGRLVIASILLKKEYVDSIRKAFQKYLGDGCCCYVPGKRFSSSDVIEKIHQAGGKAVLAHPDLIKSRKVEKELLLLPFDGVEGSHARMQLYEQRRWLLIAKEKGWMVTCGTDFHGGEPFLVTLGSFGVSREVFKEFL